MKTSYTYRLLLLIITISLSNNIVFSQNSYIISTIAGTGTNGSSGDGGLATAARFAGPYDVVKDASGNIFVADRGNHKIRRIDAVTGIITTYAGNGTQGSTGDGGPATAATFNHPSRLAVDNAGNIYVLDSFAQRIRKIDAITGIITNYAGNSTGGFSGDGGPANIAQLLTPDGIMMDNNNNLYIADRGNHRIRKVDGITGIITTVVGNGVAGFAGDGGAAIAAQLNAPTDVSVDASGNIYIAGPGKIRKVDAITGIITTVAGNGTNGYSGDGGPATAAQFFFPGGVASDNNGNLFIVDVGNHRLRKVDGTTGIVTTIAGTGTPGFSGDGGDASLAQILGPTDVSIDALGNLYLSEQNQRIRKLVPQNTTITIKADSVLANTNDTVAIPIRIKNPQGLAAFQLDIEFDNAKANYVDFQNISATLTSGGTFSFNDLGTGKVTIIWDESSASNVNFSEGDVLFEVRLKVLASAGMVTPININNLVIVSENGDELDSDTESGLITTVPPASLSGLVQTEDNQPINNVLFTLNGAITGSQTQNSATDGTYNFANLAIDNYTLTPTKQASSVVSGVNVADIILTRRHILGVTTFNSPFKIIAADADFSNSVNVADIVVLRNLILAQQTTLTNNWRFVTTNYTFTDPTNPLAEAFTESYTYNPLSSDQTNQDFTGVKVGDVNRSTNPQLRTTSEAVALAMPTQQAFKGDVLKLPVTIASNYKQIVGLQGTFEFNPEVLSFKGIEAAQLSVASDKNFNVNQSNKGLISFLYDHPFGLSDSFEDGEVLFYLTFEVIGNKNQASAIQLTNTQTQVAVYDESLKEGTKLRMAAGQIEVINPDITVFPNPGKVFNIQFAVTNESSKVKVKLHDSQGKEILNQHYTQVFKRGQHILKFDSSLPSGNYLLTFQTDQYKATKQVVVK